MAGAVKKSYWATVRRPVRILLTSPYDMAVDGGVNNQMLGLYRELAKDPAFCVRVLAPSSGHVPSGGGRIFTPGRMVSLPMNGSRANITLDPAVDGWIRRFLAEFDPDVIHLQEPLYPLIGLSVLRHNRRAGIVGTFHAYRRNMWPYWLALPWLLPFFRKIHEKTAVSPACRDCTAAVFPGRYRIIPNGIGLENWTCSAGKRFQDGKWNLLFVGRMDEPRKGFGHLLEAFDMLERRLPGRYRLIAAGRGAEKWRGRRTSGEIYWAGRAAPEALRRLYHSCDLVCAPSVRGESFGVILLEAFAFAKPVVGFKNPGYAGVMKEGQTGVLVPPGNSRDLADAIMAVSNDPVRYRDMRQKARDHVRQYDWSVIAGRYKALYRSMLADRGRGHPEAAKAGGLQSRSDRTTPSVTANLL